MLILEGSPGRVQKSHFHWGGVHPYSLRWESLHEEMTLAVCVVLLFFMTTNDLTVVFSPGQSAGTLVFLLKRPLSSFVMILLLTPPLCMFSLHKPARAWVVG